MILRNNWGKWIDLEIYTYGYDSYLLQMKVNKKNNRKKFRRSRITAGSNYSLKSVQKAIFDYKET